MKININRDVRSVYPQPAERSLRFLFAVLLGFFIPLHLYAGGLFDRTGIKGEGAIPENFASESFSDAGSLGLTGASAEEIMKNPVIILEALCESYPEVTGPEYDENAGDWFVFLNGEKFYWAEGRLLQETEKASAGNWRPFVDYLYPETTPDPSFFSDELISSLDSDVLSVTRATAEPYYYGFWDSLYGGNDRISLETHIRRFDYLGTRVSVHTSIIEPLKRVEVRILEEAEKDREVKAFVDSIVRIEGYNWREISDRPARSNHSWGIAIDILPENWSRKNVYWNWTSYWNEEWMLTPLDERWTPPEKVISIFEDEGFIWGGKWILWDNMHFEYRPELINLQRKGYSGV